MKLMTRVNKPRLSRLKKKPRVKAKAMKKRKPRLMRLRKNPSKNLKKKMVSPPKEAPKEMNLWNEHLTPL